MSGALSWPVRRNSTVCLPPDYIAAHPPDADGILRVSRESDDEPFITRTRRASALGWRLYSNSTTVERRPISTFRIGYCGAVTSWRQRWGYPTWADYIT